jgi:uncharacterized protein (DUF305 family)
MRSNLFRIAAAAFGTLGLSACASARAATPEPPTAPASVPVVRTDSAAMAKAQADSARYPYTAADIRFMTGMVGHHAQAIAMARMAPTHGASSSIQTLAGRIINAQTDEIVLMQQWLVDRRQPIPDANTMGMKMSMNGMEHVMLMPGMLSEEQMKQLDAARGAEFDRLFLTFMIQHHRGALTMVKELFGSYGAAQDLMVFKFASDANVDQTTEIARMQKMLDALPPAKPR